MLKHSSTLAVFICMFTVYSCGSESVQESEPVVDPISYTIDGTVAGIEDGEWIFLNYVDEEMPDDSAQVKDGKFIFKGKIDDNFRQAYLERNGTSDYKSVFVENQLMDIHLEPGKFGDATLNGSHTTSISDLYRDQLKDIAAKSDSLYSIETVEGTAEDDELWKQIEELEVETNYRTLEFIKAYQDEPFAAFILNIYARSMAIKSVNELYDNLSPEVKGSRYGEEVQSFLKTRKDVSIGNDYSDFTSLDLERKETTLSQHLGPKLTLIDFWASWCGPCRMENPSVVKAYKKYHDKGLEIVGVSLDDKGDKWKKAIAKDELPWVQLSELNGWNETAAQMYGVSGIPDNFLIDANGKIVARGLRGNELIDKIGEALN